MTTKEESKPIRDEKFEIQRTVVIGGKRYEISNHPEDNARRCNFFRKHSTGSLKFDGENCESKSEKKELYPDEKTLLKDLGINIDEDISFVYDHAYDLYVFFKEIHNCQTTTALTLNHGCSTIHYILFSILHQAQEKAKKEFEKTKKSAISTDKLASLTKKIDSFRNFLFPTPQPVPQTKQEAIFERVGAKKETFDEDIFDIFTLEV
jgi:hypothetical protein